MTPLLFWSFAILALLFACSVVLQRNPVASALSLVVSFMGLAALFVTLDAYFIAIIQILVYAGAVMVLFLFIIMLLDLKAEARRKMNPLVFVGGAVVAVAFVAQLVMVLNGFDAGKAAFPALANAPDDVRQVGFTLFTSFNLPFQVLGVLVLVATIGVVVMSKRELK